MTEANEFLSGLRRSGYRSFLLKKWTGLPLYFRKLQKASRPASERNVLEHWRMEISIPHRTGCHILNKLPRTPI
jgi:hypothetical protein